MQPRRRQVASWIILASFILVVVPLLGLLLLGGLSIRLILVFRLVPLDWFAVRDANTRLLLPVIAALHEPCDSYFSLIRIRWVSRNILELVLVTSRVHAIIASIHLQWGHLWYLGSMITFYKYHVLLPERRRDPYKRCRV